MFAFRLCVGLSVFLAVMIVCNSQQGTQGRVVSEDSDLDDDLWTIGLAAPLDNPLSGSDRVHPFPLPGPPVSSRSSTKKHTAKPVPQSWSVPNDPPTARSGPG
jgi:hypothetical protein